ncbi:hypothetical protein K435DRAFT_26913 [Dendrothele bispora CBS 962.96]|uniref:Uncharacterized protein n=1 Tax=Dendrothele bispora (strain CBS 962.96) TaxID=1314807 RepID=A0A4S8M870_DENBC|nr:hypothetical protein K435DRAFT_26913 [Dendrothele bispora CBS 962.96]
MDDIPAEIFSRIFEIGVHQWGIGFLPPLCLTCRQWYSVIETTPRLWGILVLRKKMNFETFHAQMRKAKASPLSVTVMPNATRCYPHSALSNLATSWVYANIPLSVLKQTNWNDLSALETLVLRGDGELVPDPEIVDSFFQNDTSRPKSALRSLSVKDVPFPWIRGMLSSYISHFQMTGRTQGIHPYWMVVRERPCNRISETFGCLSLIPNVAILSLANLNHCRCHPYSGSLVHLDQLTVLELNKVSNFSAILSKIRAPALQSLSITSSPSDELRTSYYYSYYNTYTSDNDTSDNDSAIKIPFSTVFAEWSHSGSLPSQLTDLELNHCLTRAELPYLIRWLRRLPRLSRFTIGLDSTVLDGGLTEDCDIFRALSVPYRLNNDTEGQGSEAWLCPALVQLCVEAQEVRVADLLAIAQARNVPSTTRDLQQTPGKLRCIYAAICYNGSEKEVEELRNLVEEMACRCFGCQLTMA